MVPHLKVVFDTFAQRMMEDETNIGFVDSHAERHRRTNHLNTKISKNNKNTVVTAAADQSRIPYQALCTRHISSSSSLNSL